MASTDLIFKGEFVHQLDDKVRFKLPVKMQEAFEEMGTRAVMMMMPEQCLALYPVEAWEREYGRFVSGSSQHMPGNADYRRLSRYVGSRSTDTKIGAQGRVAIPDGFREYINAEAGMNIVIVGSGERIEIWSEAAWSAGKEGGSEDFGALLEKAAELMARAQRDNGDGEQQ